MYHESDDELRENEYPDDDDLDNQLDDPDEYSVSCPNCQSLVYDDSDYCPHCGTFITQSTHPFSGKPVMWVGLGVLGIAIVIATLVFGSW